MIKKSPILLIPAMIFALILLVGASPQTPVKAKSSAYSASKVLAVTYSWKQDHCESCDYLAEQIKRWMRYAKENWYVESAVTAANMAANYLKLYELNKCHEFYRNTSIGPFHLALELKALEEKASGKTGKTGKVLE